MSRVGHVHFETKKKQNVMLGGLSVEGRLCWGGLGKGGEWGIVRHLWGNLGDGSEGKTIYGSILIFKDLKRGINKNIVWLFERHKPSPPPNTIIVIKVMALTSGKHSEHDTEPACFIIRTSLKQLRHRKLHCTPWSA